VDLSETAPRGENDTAPTKLKGSLRFRSTTWIIKLIEIYAEVGGPLISSANG
jgi:hypothetical protein